MSRTWTDIVTEMAARRKDRQPTLDAMQEVADRYKGDYVIPFPGADAHNQLPPMAPAIIADAIDHTAMHAASVMPMIHFPALDAAKETGVRSKQYADIRRRAIASIWSLSGMPILMRKAFRQLIGYGTFCMMAVPDFETGRATVQVRDPLSAFPEPKSHTDISKPANCGFVNARSADWIRRNFPQAGSGAGGIIPESGNGETMWDMLEWVDEDQIVFGLLGPREELRRRASEMPSMPNMELARFPNRARMAGVVCPARVTLEDVAGQVRNIIGQVDLLNRLMMLEVVGTEQLIFPDRYIVGSSERKPKLLNGEWKRGTIGEPNIIIDASEIGTFGGSVDPQSRITMDRVERNARTSGGLLPQFGGETFNSLRTGRGMDAMAGMALEPRIQELHEVMAYNLAFLNEALVEVSKGYWPSKEYVQFSGWPGDSEVVQYIPKVHFETGYNVVSYPIPGADSSRTTVELSQQLGAGAISMQSYRERHPHIRDPATEEKRVNLEAFENVVRGAMEQGILQGSMAIEDVISAADKIKEGMDIFETVKLVQNEAQERQATIAEEQAANQVAPPATLPGINPPGTGAEQPGAPDGLGIGPSQDQQGLFRLIGATRAGLGRGNAP